MMNLAMTPQVRSDGVDAIEPRDEAGGLGVPHRNIDRSVELGGRGIVHCLEGLEGDHTD